MFCKNIKCHIISWSQRFYAKNVAKNLKGRTVSSQNWLKRQLADPYVEKSRMLNYRSRSAFKLLEIDDKYKLIKSGDVIVDCGAAPGGWTQVAVHRSNADGNAEKSAKGAVFSIDILPLYPINGATILNGMDFTKKETQEFLKDALADRLVNCVISDMAPNASGIKMLDQENILRLGYHALQFATLMSAPQAHLIIKVWNSADVIKLEQCMRNFYESVKRVKPPSSRCDSSEFYLVARTFKK